jgi:hypothetical protein
MFLRTPSVGAADMCGVLVILILGAWQTSQQEPQDLIKLNTKASSLYVGCDF